MARRPRSPSEAARETEGAIPPEAAPEVADGGDLEAEAAPESVADQDLLAADQELIDEADGEPPVEEQNEVVEIEIEPEEAEEYEVVEVAPRPVEEEVTAEGQPPVEDAPEDAHVLEDVRQVEDDQPVEAPEGDEGDAWPQLDDEYDYAQNGFPPMYAGPPVSAQPSRPSPSFLKLQDLLRSPEFAGRTAPTDFVEYRGQLRSLAELRRRGLI